MIHTAERRPRARCARARARRRRRALNLQQDVCRGAPASRDLAGSVRCPERCDRAQPSIAVLSWQCRSTARGKCLSFEHSRGHSSPYKGTVPRFHCPSNLQIRVSGKGPSVTALRGKPLLFRTTPRAKRVLFYRSMPRQECHTVCRHLPGGG